MSAPLIIVMVLSLCYSLTIAPDITWAHFSADGGDLITATATGGVPHPSGYPLYVILARPFQFLPVGTLAFRTNLFSAICTILAALVLYAFLVRQLRGRLGVHFVALFAALAYGLAPFVWGQALVTEVYALHGLLVIICIYTLSLEKLKGGEWTRGFIFGIAATNHLTSVMIFPLILLDFHGKRWVSARTFLIRCIGIASGLVLYLLLPLRAYSHSPVNWGDASTLSGFFWLVSGQIYHTYVFKLVAADIIQRFRAFAGLLLEQYTWIGALLGIYGLFSLHSRRILILTLWIATTSILYAVFYGSKDSQVNLLPVWLIFAVWLAYGLQDLFEFFHDRSRVQLLFAGLLFAILIIRIPFTLPSVDISGDSQAQEFIDQTLTEIPKDSLIFVEGDAQIFSLWYAQYALNQRLDITIIAKGLLPYKWYTENLQHTYPDINIPERSTLQIKDLIAANPDRVVCYISADKPLRCTQTTSHQDNTSKECYDLDLICLQGKPLSLTYSSRLL